jgi:hypothetical protein
MPSIESRIRGSTSCVIWSAVKWRSILLTRRRCSERLHPRRARSADAPVRSAPLVTLTRCVRLPRTNPLIEELRAQYPSLFGLPVDGVALISRAMLRIMGETHGYRTLRIPRSNATADRTNLLRAPAHRCARQWLVPWRHRAREPGIMGCEHHLKKWLAGRASLDGVHGIHGSHQPQIAFPMPPVGFI